MKVMVRAVSGDVERSRMVIGIDDRNRRIRKEEDAQRDAFWNGIYKDLLQKCVKEIRP